MSDPPAVASSPSSETRPPSGELAVLAALVPSGFALFACLLFGLAASGHGSFLYAIAEMGTSFYFVLLASLAAIVGVSVLLYFAARGVSVPAALTVALASLPWLTGVAGARWGVHIAASAVAAADPSTRATILAVGVAEATQARLFGSLIASGLLAAVAFGLALGAIGQRAQGRSFAGGAIGLVAAFPLLALAGYATLAARLGGLGLLLAASGAMLATALAATGAGADSTRGRSGALASAAPIAAGLAVQAAAVAASSISLIEVFSAIANVDPASRVQLVAAGAREMAPLSWALVLCVPLSLVAAAAVAVWSATRARPTPTSLVGAGALLLTIGVIVSADGLAMGGASEDLREMGAPPWARVVGVDPVAIDRSDGSLEVQGIVTPEGLHRRDGSLAASFDPSALDRAVAELHAEALRSPDLMWEPPPGEDEQDPLRSRAELGLVLDARLGVDGLRALFAAASRAQIPAVDLVGPGAGAPTDAEREAVESVYPLLAPFLDSRGSVGVVLAGPTLAARAEEDAQLFHATVGAVPPTVAEVRADAEVPAEERALSPRGDRYRAIDRFGDERGPIYLALGEGVTTSSLVDTLERAAASGFVPVIAIGAIPGHPERPAPQILEGAEVGGALSREAIRAVVRRHLPEIRDCYERALVAAPELEGRVTVSFVISTTGAVDRATVGSTTLNDATVESCITSAVARWRFPAPDGGGLVTVNYPFVLQSE